MRTSRFDEVRTLGMAPPGTKKGWPLTCTLPSRFDSSLGAGATAGSVESVAAFRRMPTSVLRHGRKPTICPQIFDGTEFFGEAHITLCELRRIGSRFKQSRLSMVPFAVFDTKELSQIVALAAEHSVHKELPALPSQWRSTPIWHPSHGVLPGE